MKTYEELAGHILDEIGFIRANCRDLAFAAFQADEVLKRAVVRSLEIIGEAVKNIPSDVLNEYPGTDWKSIAGMRDRLIYHYFGVDYYLVWDVIRNHVPALENAVQRMLSGGKA